MEREISPDMAEVQFEANKKAIEDSKNRIIEIKKINKRNEKEIKKYTPKVMADLEIAQEEQATENERLHNIKSKNNNEK